MPVMGQYSVASNVWQYCASKKINTRLWVTGSVNLPVMLQCVQTLYHLRRRLCPVAVLARCEIDATLSCWRQPLLAMQRCTRAVTISGPAPVLPRRRARWLRAAPCFYAGVNHCSRRGAARVQSPSSPSAALRRRVLARCELRHAFMLAPTAAVVAKCSVLQLLRTSTLLQQ